MVPTERLKSILDQAINDSSVWRNIIAVVSIATMLLPWVYPDGSQSPLTGADLIAYTFSGPERGAMVRESFLGAASLFTVPLLILVMAIAVFIKTYRGHHPIALNVATGLLPLLVLIFAGKITSSEHLIAGGLVFPGLGIILLFLCQVALAVQSLTQRR